MVSKRVQTKQIKTEGAKKIISDSTLSVYQILTQEAACFYGAGTKWCTAGQKDNAFDQYNRQGPIYVILTDGRKFQLHVESSQFMNEQDSAVSKTDIAMLSKSPAYTKFLNMLIKKHYGKFLGI